MIWVSLLQCSDSIIPERRIHYTSFIYYAFSPLSHKVVFSCLLDSFLIPKNVSKYLPEPPAKETTGVDTVPCLSCTNALTIQTTLSLFFERDTFHSQGYKSNPYFLKLKRRKKRRIQHCCGKVINTSNFQLSLVKKQTNSRSDRKQNQWVMGTKFRLTLGNYCLLNFF